MKINEDLLPIIVSNSEPIGQNRKHIWIRQTENLMNLNSMFGNANYFTISGNTVTLLKDDTRPWTDVQEGYWGIKLKRGTYTLKLSQVITKIQYGFNGAAAGTVNNSDTVTFTVNTDDRVVHFKFFAAAYPTTINWFMLNTGDNAKAFVPYVDSKFYILNANDRYEEFNSQNEVYSMGEQRIGTWIDGKPLYRRVIVSTNLSTNTSNSMSISGASTISVKKIDGYIIGGGGGHIFAAGNSSGADSENTRSFVFYAPGSGTIQSYCGMYHTGNGKYDIYVIIEYTKTTD